MTILIELVKDIKTRAEEFGRPIAIVPTMGALHAGHISLIKMAKAECKTVVVTIFVNPLQFGPNEDFNKYPRDLETDFKICQENEVDIVFAPTKEEIYPDINKIEQDLIVPPDNLASVLCGKTRQNHFSGVCTIVKKLFDIVTPDYAYFGEKDLQQLYIVRWLVKTFTIPTFIRACPIIREASGLAYSSRNKYLTEEQKIMASNIYKALKLAKQNIRSGIFTINKALLEGLIFLSQFPEIKVEYLDARDKEDFSIVDKNKTGGIYCLIAANVGGVRLIDNIELQ